MANSGVLVVVRAMMMMVVMMGLMLGSLVKVSCTLRGLRSCCRGHFCDDWRRRTIMSLRPFAEQVSKAKRPSLAPKI